MLPGLHVAKGCRMWVPTGIQQAETPGPAGQLQVQALLGRCPSWRQRRLDGDPSRLRKPIGIRIACGKFVHGPFVYAYRLGNDRC